MFGCLRRLGCLVVVLFAVGLWLVRDWWWPTASRLMRREPEVAADARTPVWQPLDQGRAQVGERAVRALAARSGPVYVNLHAADLASYAFLSLSTTLPSFARDAEAAVIGDRVYVRSLVSVKDLGGVVGGAVGGLLPTRDTLHLGGTFDVVRPGLAEFRVRDVRIGRLPLPASVVPTLVGRVRRGELPQGVAADAIPFRIPAYIGDVRVARGRITLYKATR